MEFEPIWPKIMQFYIYLMLCSYNFFEMLQQDMTQTLDNSNSQFRQENSFWHKQVIRAGQKLCSFISHDYPFISTFFPNVIAG